MSTSSCVCVCVCVCVCTHEAQHVNCVYIVSLNLDNTIVNSTLPSEIGKLSFLEEMRLLSTMLIGTLPSELANLRNLGECALLFRLLYDAADALNLSYCCSITLNRRYAIRGGNTSRALPASKPALNLCSN